MEPIEYEPCNLFEPGELKGEYVARIFETNDPMARAGYLQDFLNDAHAAGYEPITFLVVGPLSAHQVLCVVRRTHTEAR